MADPKAEAIKRLDEEEKARLELAKRKHGNPTPTQRESDLARLGLLNIDEKEPTGADPDPHALQPKALHADEPAGYKTKDLGKK